MPEQQWINRLVRYQYIEEILPGQRVLEVGCGSGGGAHFLAERAAEVVAIDTASAKLSEARSAFRRRNLRFALAEPDRLDQSDDAFDIVLVPELERWITRGALIPELKRVLRPGGLALFAVPTEDAPNGMEYTDLLEYLSTSFPQVRTVGEIPFHGTIMADFEPDDLDPQLDCTLVEEDEPPAYYLALCSEEPVECVGYSVVQVGPEAVDGTRGRLETALEQARREVDRAQDMVHDLQTELSRASEEQELLRGERERLSEALDAASAEGTGQQASPAGLPLQGRVGELEAQLTAARRDVERLAAAGRRGEELRQELAACRERGAEVTGENTALKEQLADAERRVLEASTKARQEATGLRRQQREREDAIAKLRDELGQSRRALAEARQMLRTLDRDKTLPQWTMDVTPTDGAGASAAAQRLRAASAADRAQDAQARLGEMEQELARERQRNEQMRDRLEEQAQRADEAAQQSVEARAAAETASVRSEAARQGVEELKSLADQQRKRAEGAERRADTLLNRLEQDAAELSRLHQRLAEMQGLRQADQWRMDELTGRLREAEARGGGEGATPAAPTRVRPSREEGEAKRLKQSLREAEAKVAELDKELMKEQSRHEAAQRQATNAEAKVAQLEVKLKRAEAEASTLSKWAEDLRGELKEAKGGESAVPPTPEPEVSTLRGELAEACQRVEVLEARCEALMAEVREGQQRLADSEEELGLARKAADGQGLQDLRARAEQVKRMEATIREQRERIAELEALQGDVRDGEQSATELKATREELAALRTRVKDVDGASDELEQLRLESRRSADLEAELRAELEQLSRRAAQAEAAREEAVREARLARQAQPTVVQQGAATGGAAAEPQQQELIELRERQLEALLDGALMHREEVAGLKRRIDELRVFCDELEGERRELTDQLECCQQDRQRQADRLEALRGELVDKGRALATAEGLLRRVQGEDAAEQAPA